MRDKFIGIIYSNNQKEIEDYLKEIFEDIKIEKSKKAIRFQCDKSFDGLDNEDILEARDVVRDIQERMEHGDICTVKEYWDSPHDIKVYATVISKAKWHEIDLDDIISDKIREIEEGDLND